MSARRLGLLFAIGLLAALALLFPLRLAIGLADPQAIGLAADRVSGPVWAGRLSGARLRGHELGEVHLRLAPLPLLIGVRRLDLRGAGASARLLQGRRNGIAEASATLALADAGLAPGLSPVLRLERASVVFADGRCLRAEGGFVLELRRADAAEDAAPLTTLNGSPTCSGRSAELAWTADAIDPAAGLDDLQASLRIDADGRWRLQSLARTGDAGAALLLEAAGFVPGPGGWSRSDEGQLD